MDKVYATLRTFGVLLGLLVILAVVAIATNQVPQFRRGPVTVDGGILAPDGGVAAILDASGPAAPDAGGPSVADASVDAGPEPVVALAGQRWEVCEGGAAESSLAIAQLVGDARRELIVGCPDGWHVIADGPLGLQRVAVYRVPAAAAGQRIRTGRAAVGDVDADGRPDLVLPLAFETDRRATRGGGLYIISNDAFGGIREPLRLAPIAAVHAAIAPIDGIPGAEVVAINRANALAQLPSEAWIFAGGAAPTRLAALPTGLAGDGVEIADVDRDGHVDVIALAEDRVDLFFGSAAGTFERTHTLSMEGARELGVGDIDGDHGTDLVVLGTGLSWLHAGPLEGMEPRGVDGTPATLRDLGVLDVDADGHLDFVGWDHPRLLVLYQRPDIAFEPAAVLELAGTTFAPSRVVLTALDADATIDDVVLLGTASRDGALELLLVRNALPSGVLTPPDTAQRVPDAPLRIEAALP